MADMRTGIEAAVRRKQRGMSIKTGDRLVRGIRAVRVLSVDNGVEWIDTASSETTSATRGEFLSRAILRLSSKVVAPASILDAAWDVAGARGAPPRLRAQALYPFVDAAESEEDRGVIRGWIDVLLGDVEPER